MIFKFFKSVFSTFAGRSDCENVFKKYLMEAEKGKSIIEKYYQIYNEKQRIVVLIFPDDDSQLLSAVFKYLDDFLNEYHYDSAIILPSIDLASLPASKPLHFYNLSQSDMNAVLRFYSIAQECPNVKLFSFRMPFNQKASNLIGFKDITADKFTYHYLFGMFGKEYCDE